MLQAIRILVYRACLTTIYGCGFCLLEGARLQVTQVDSARMAWSGFGWVSVVSASSISASTCRHGSPRSHVTLPRARSGLPSTRRADDRRPEGTRRRGGGKQNFEVAGSHPGREVDQRPANDAASSKSFIQVHSNAVHQAPVHADQVLGCASPCQLRSAGHRSFAQPAVPAGGRGRIRGIPSTQGAKTPLMVLIVPAA